MGRRLPVYNVASCVKCVFSRGGEEWSPICDAPTKSHPRGGRFLPKDHVPDGPPPSWCPLPIEVRRG